jgi:AcrR family transcriptional regulator
VSTVGRPREHDETTGERLLDAAEALLAQGGVDAVSVRGVADAIGTSTRAVYSVFGSKEGLLHHLARRGYVLLADLVDGLELTDDPVEDLVRVGVDGFRRFAIGRPHLFRITFERVMLEVRADRDVLASGRRSYDALVRHLERAKNAGVLGDRTIEDAAFQFHSTCQGLATNELLHERPPVGSRMWGQLPAFDGASQWRAALRALVTGMATTSA